MENGKKYCKHCAEVIDVDCIICPKCGKQVEQIGGLDKNIIINNNNSASSSAAASASARVYAPMGRAKNKWVAFLLCLFTVCGHKFYEGKFMMGVVYLLTIGLFGIGWMIDLIALLMKPNPYYV